MSEQLFCDVNNLIENRYFNVTGFTDVMASESDEKINISKQSFLQFMSVKIYLVVTWHLLSSGLFQFHGRWGVFFSAFVL